MKTKIEMVKDIFFLATEGMRTPANYPYGMWLIEMIADHNNKWFITKCWDDVINVPTSIVKNAAHCALRSLIWATYGNTIGVRGDWTPTYREVSRVASMFHL